MLMKFHISLKHILKYTGEKFQVIFVHKNKDFAGVDVV